ncbi:MAG: polysaccharide pyruvyl transferase family protein [Azospirillaceae bacterium]
MSRGPRVLLVGFYGVPNLGDELLCRAVIARVRAVAPGARITVLAADAEVARRYSGLDDDVAILEGFYPTPRFRRAWKSHLDAAGRADLVVLGGGGLISDRHHWSSVPRYALPALAALAAGRPVIAAGLGIPGLRRFWLRRLSAALVGAMARVGVRDMVSASQAEVLGARPEAVRPGRDMAPVALAGRLDRSTPAVVVDRWLVNLRADPPLPEAGVTAMLERLAAAGAGIDLLVAEPVDRPYYEALVAAVTPGAAAACRVIEPETLDEALGIVRRARGVLAERLHVVVAAIGAARPLVAVPYESKVTTALAEFEAGAAVVAPHEIGAGTADRLFAARGNEAAARRLADAAPAIAAEIDDLLRAGVAAPAVPWNRRLAAGLWLTGLTAFALVKPWLPSPSRLRARVARAPAAHS